MGNKDGVASSGSTIWGKISTNITRAFRLDSVTHALETIDYEHHEIHGGGHYTAAFAKTLGVSTTSNILIVTPDTTKWSHFVFEGVSNAALTLSLYESPDYAGGAALSSLNNNRNSSETSGLTLTTDATDSGGGLGTLLFSSSAGANARAGTIDRVKEYILKQNTKYLVKIDGANTNITTTILEYYEHTSRD